MGAGGGKFKVYFKFSLFFIKKFNNSKQQLQQFETISYSISIYISLLERKE